MLWELSEVFTRYMCGGMIYDILYMYNQLKQKIKMCAFSKFIYKNMQIGNKENIHYLKTMK